ncbi:trifunctional serine/threonine-protein kinase/ATP-binding protein/sensor histidine kinase [Brunnivagina elsteri]|uniref:histidine kinase n=1 Tax=Brunnivagina elsteri CCALA 953 TaxID=987040 RepID=A0A2A2TKB1_9CYAN|nr:AAA family ATPase [Calothrix elsteri]PAX57100.1 histidine kinase [Calothrix elsteri CCALA 953]
MISTQVSIPGYQVSEELYNGSRTLVYRAVREVDQKPVVIKLLKNPYPSFSELLQFRNQYTIAKNLNTPGIIQTYSLEPYQNGYILVMEDFGGISLKDYFANNNNIASLDEFLQIAISLCDTLDILYRQRIIHKDIKPSNILIHLETKQVKLIDFSIASLLARETQTLISLNVLEGTLAYISPEQTGRMNRGIDYRTDFYSLGVTFYELLTGELPFQSNDAMELVHSHIAKQVPVLADSKEIPQVISDILIKLMAKNAEDRYQSALGLKHDLEKCLYQLKETGKITYFEIGKRDICDSFIIPDKLYGRETEVETLLQAFERVSTGTTEMMLVAGFSGIGKTAIVNEVHKPIVRQRGYFIKGKFDQFNRNIPFSAFVQAFRDLMGQLLTESDAQIQQWKSKILEAVGENGQVIIEVIPELSIIIGNQAPAQELSGSAAQNRFNLLFQKFVQVFTTKEHPLVIFLDDLQWADSASLKLMQLLIADTGHLFLIGAYRDNEVFPAHPLILTLSDIQKTAATINTITLAPLNQGKVNELVADTLKCTESLAFSFSQLIYQKTQGNPFFATQFLKALHQDGLIKFNFESGYWQCNIAQVTQRSLTSDVVELMALQLQKLPESTQEVLKLAACIGNQFDLQTLAIVSEKSEIETATDLWTALQEGLILPQSEVYKFYQGEDNQQLDMKNDPSKLLAKYKFLHDRVQQAAYSLIPEDQKQLTHLTIGQLLLQNTEETRQDERIFEIVNQLNCGISPIALPVQRRQYAQLNLKAGRKAKESTAYITALHYLNYGIQFLTAKGWDVDADLMHNLHEEAAEVALLNCDFPQMESLVEIVLQRTSNLLEQVKVYEIKLQAYQVQNQQREAIKSGREILEKLGVILPESVTPLEMQQQVENTLTSVGSVAIADLVNLPQMQDANALAALRIMIRLVPSIHQAAPQLFPSIACEQLNLSFKYGNSPFSAPGYADFGIVVSIVLNQLEAGYQFGQLALCIMEQFSEKSVQSMVQFKVAAFNQSNRQNIRQSIALLKKSYQVGLETGDSVHALVSTSFRLLYTYLSGVEDLGSLLKELEIYQSRFATSQHFLSWAHIIRYSIKNFTEFDENPRFLGHDVTDEKQCLSLLLKDNDELALHLFFLSKLILSYSFGDFSAAIQDADTGVKYLQAGMGMPSAPVYYYYDSLIRLTVYPTDPSQQEKLLSQVEENQQKLSIYADAAPMNYQQKYDLVEAVRCHICDNKLAAMECFDRAIAKAQENGYILDEALANELAAKFYLDWVKEKVAAGYMQEAYYCYTKWGAKAKTDDLETRYPQLLKPILQQRQVTLNPWETISTVVFPRTSSSTHTSSTNISDALDFTSILKAAQAISSSIELDELITNLTKIILENSGAKKSVLILPQEDTWQVRAITLINHQAQIQTILNTQLVDTCQDIPGKIINYVKNTQQTIVIDNCQTDIPGVIGEYMLEHQPKSLLCTPIINQGHLQGILYLENQLTTGVFTSERLQVINLLSSHAAISLENARLYQESQENAQQLKQSLKQQKTLFNVVNQMRKSLDLDTIFCTVTQNIRRILNADRVGIYQFHLNVNYEYGEFIAEDVLPAFPSALAVKIQDHCFGENYANLYKQGRFGVINDLQAADILDCHREILGQFQIQASLVVPIIQDDELWGLLCIHQCDRPRHWLPSEIQFAQQVGAQMGVALKQIDLLIATQKQATQLEQTLQHLQQTQLQLVQNEKMSALGNLVAGIAHEMNNPLGFISASLKQAKPTVADITEHLKLYQENLPNPGEEIIDHAEEIDLDYSLEDLPKIIDAIVMACDRLKNISTSLRTFSRADQDYKVPFNIHEGIDSTILILKHRLKANEQRPAIEVVAEYGNLPQIECFPGQLNQVFMNILANAIDALDESNTGRSFAEIQANPNKITIKTSIEDNQVKISIADNGKGMSEEVKHKIFDHLFTTKGVSKGTGLGLAIAHQIVTEKHGGEIAVNSVFGEGTEFMIFLPIKN